VSPTQCPICGKEHRLMPVLNGNMDYHTDEEIRNVIETWRDQANRNAQVLQEASDEIVRLRKYIEALSKDPNVRNAMLVLKLGGELWG